MIMVTMLVFGENWGGGAAILWGVWGWGGMRVL